MYACGGEDTPAEDLATPRDMTAVPVPHNFKQIDNLVLQGSCATFSVCHSNAGQVLADKLNICSGSDPAGTSPQICDPTSTLASAYAALYEKPAVNKQAASEGLLLVKPCDPDHSFLVKKLELPTSQIDAKTGYGAHMPNGSAALDPVQLKAIRDWISRGAHLNEPDDVTGSTCVLSTDGGT